MQQGRRHGASHAHGNGCGCREAWSHETAYDGWEADQAIFESAAHPGGRKCARCHGADRAGRRRRRGGCRWLLAFWCFHTRGCQNRCRLHSPHEAPVCCARGALGPRWWRSASPSMAGRPVHGCP